jgi:hypothetical protein
MATLDSYISEVSYAGSGQSDFIEVVLPAGTDVTGYFLELYQEGGQDSYSVLLFPPLTATIAGNDDYVFSKDTVVNFPSAMGDGEGIALVDPNGSVLQFVSHGLGSFTAVDGAAAGLTSQYIGSATTKDTGLVTNDRGDTYEVTGTLTPGSVACFAEGTLIRTLDGYVPIERLRPGIMLPTWSAGLQELKLIRYHEMSYSAQTPDRQRLVLFPPKLFDCTGSNHPLILSSNHRIPLAVGKERRLLLFPAKTLVGWRGIRFMRGRRHMRWVHLGLPVHALIESSGFITESLLPGEMVERTLTGLERAAWAPVSKVPCLPLIHPQEARALIEEGVDLPHPNELPMRYPTGMTDSLPMFWLAHHAQGRADINDRTIRLHS